MPYFKGFQQPSPKKCFPLVNLNSVRLSQRQMLCRIILQLRTASSKPETDIEFFKSARKVAASQREAEAIMNGARERAERLANSRAPFREALRGQRKKSGQLIGIVKEKCSIMDLVEEEMHKDPSIGRTKAMLCIKEKIDEDAQSSRPRLTRDERRHFMEVWTEVNGSVKYLRIAMSIGIIATVAWIARWTLDN